ncbi:MAG: hypothetical protein ACI8PZ_001699 [Myxococcota bacterium]|jgi:hypothetical protein
MHNWRVWVGRVIGAGLISAGAILLGAGPPDTWPWLVRLFGPPRMVASEAHDAAGRARVDRGALDALLREHVRDGVVDYPAIGADPRLAAYLEVVANAPWDELSRDAKLALAINAYNAFTLALILDHAPLTSIKDIPAPQRWDAARWSFAGRTVSLSQLEHEELRGNFIEPRIHFAINCASVGCPPLRSEAYDPERLEAQLEDQSRALHAHPRWLRIDGRTVQLTKLYAWYAEDFDPSGAEPLAYPARWAPQLLEGDWSVAWLDYDWSLNGPSP